MVLHQKLHVATGTTPRKSKSRAPTKLNTGPAGNNHFDYVEGRLAEWCIMSPSNQRLRELSAMEVNMAANKRDLAAIGPPNSGINNNSSKEYGKKHKPYYPWDRVRGKLQGIVPFLKQQPTKDKGGGVSDVKQQVVQEEMQEFLQTPGIPTLKYPLYFSKEDETLLQAVAYKHGLSCKKTESHLIVYKPNVRSEDVAVNLPELASKGHDSFLKTLRLTRMDSAGGRRSDMLWEVHQSARKAQANHNGTGGIYTIPASDGHNVAMFKPMEEERFVREGLEAGEGAVREEAAYVLDSRSGGFSAVPPTAVAELNLSTAGVRRKGSVQRFMQSKMGSLEEFGMSRDLAKASAFIPVSEIHKIGILDIRVFNTDRHSGNLLLLGDKAPYSLVPIDHGCILPSWYHLAEARFDWAEFPQAKCPFSGEMLQHIKSLNCEGDAVALRKLGIREECVTTMKMSTLFLQIAAEHGKTLQWIARIMLRDGCLEKPSAFEKMVLKACESSGIPFRFVSNDYNEQSGVIEPGILSRRLPKSFFDALIKLFVAKCKP